MHHDPKNKKSRVRQRQGKGQKQGRRNKGL